MQAPRNPTIATDGNDAAVSVAYRASEVVAIYPITPASPMGERADAWAAEGRPNIFGSVPSIVEMQSEAGAAGLLHGALQTGALATTFTSSQGLLLMLPDMFRIAGELMPAVIHVAARALATHALSIFGDHSDVMAVRASGFAMLSSGSVQEAGDLAAIAHAATLESHIPFMHFFDGFRTSHEVNTIVPIPDGVLREMVRETRVLEHRRRALSPDHPVLRGSAQNPDVFFQARERSSPYYAACARHTQRAMDQFAELTGRRYQLFDWYGAPDAERAIILMGSAAETAETTARHLIARGEKVGVLRVRLFRPFDVRSFAKTLPPTVRRIAVLDRTKEPGSIGEPLYLDVVGALHEAFENVWTSMHSPPLIIGGRYGLGSKELTAGMIAAVFAELEEVAPKERFTLGIDDDVSGTSLRHDATLDVEPASVRGAIFFGLGSDGTVGATKSSAKILVEEAGLHAQTYSVYDSKKSGSVTESHLRFGPEPIRAPYLIAAAHSVACHHETLLDKVDVLARLGFEGLFLIAADPQTIAARLPEKVRSKLIEKRARVYAIDARKIARERGLGGHVNTIMQACWFALSQALPIEEALEAIEKTIRAAYGKRGEAVVAKNIDAVRAAIAAMVELQLDAEPTLTDLPAERRPRAENAPYFVQNVLLPILHGEGDQLPVSAFTADGTFPTGTSKFEKRSLAEALPVWSPEPCIQCGKCAFVCPHAAIRIKAYEPSLLERAPSGFRSTPARDRSWDGLQYSIQVAPDDCTGCTLCAQICPVDQALKMAPIEPLRDIERESWNYFLQIPELERDRIKTNTIRQQQIEQPLFEFSGACVGCGETPYLKLLSQLFGDRTVIANATGCSSIFGGNLPTTPWTKNAEGRGPAWENSLFEDNAELGLGFRVSIDHQRALARRLLAALAPQVGPTLACEILEAKEVGEAAIRDQRLRITELKRKLATFADDPAGMAARHLLSIADLLSKKSVWIVGGDGWAYDIGFGGLDHVLASGRDVNVLVLDTEVYSNTGGQTSKATPLGAVAKFSADGKRTAKKDLGWMAMSYGNVYVACVAMGAKDEHTLRVFLEAESYPGPSLIIAYSHCIAHGIDMTAALEHQANAVASGSWILYRFDPRRVEKGESPLVIDSKPAELPIAEYMAGEDRFRMLTRDHPEEAQKIAEESARQAIDRRRRYEQLAKLTGK